MKISIIINIKKHKFPSFLSFLTPGGMCSKFLISPPSIGWGLIREGGLLEELLNVNAKSLSKLIAFSTAVIVSSTFSINSLYI